MSTYKDTSLTARATQMLPQPQLSGPDQALASFCEPGTEFDIVKFVDETGQTWYRVYNPETFQFQWFSSEAEVWQWLD